MNIEIEFESECFKCYGNGYLLSSKGEKIPCERCRATGYAPTELGKALLEFLENQGFKPATSTKEYDEVEEDEREIRRI